MVSFMVFAFGLAIGSFLNAFIYRLEVQQGLRQIFHDREKSDVSIMRGRSFCPHCGHTLSWSDLVPLLSFVFLRGRCRYCVQRISFQYPLVELATGFLFVALSVFVVPWLSQGVDNLGRLSFTQVEQLLYLFYLWIITSALIVVFVYDLKHSLIPDKILFLAIGTAVFWRIFEFLNFDILNLFRLPAGEAGVLDLGFGISAPLVVSLLAGLGTSLFFFTIYAASKGRAMGFGDVKLAFLLGLFLGWPSILVALFAAFCLGAVVGIVLITLKKKGLKSEVPFAPFLILGTAIAFFFGSPIIHWYLGLFLV